MWALSNTHRVEGDEFPSLKGPTGSLPSLTGEKTPRHILKYLQKHKSEESLLQDPEGTGFVKNMTLNFRAAILEAKKVMEQHRKVLREKYFHLEFVTKLSCECESRMRELSAKRGVETLPSHAASLKETSRV